jgi:DNA-binding transcriptional ArsR family regulator
MNSLVARAFLIQPRFRKVKDIAELLEQRGEGVALSTVSKALKRLEEDLVVTRGDQIRLAQGDTILDRLVANYEPPSVESRFVGKAALEAGEMAQLLATAAAGLRGKVAVTGEASAEQYATMAREPLLSVYTTLSPSSLLDASGIKAKETQRFANLEIIQTSDRRVFSDVRCRNGVPFASPVQTYLELATGDKRQKDAANQVRDAILASLLSAGEDSHG